VNVDQGKRTLKQLFLQLISQSAGIKWERKSFQVETHAKTLKACDILITELQPIACFANGHRGHALHKPVASEGVVNVKRLFLVVGE